MSDVNPLIPAEYDAVWTVVVASVFAAMAVGVVLLIRFLARRR